MEYFSSLHAVRLYSKLLLHFAMIYLNMTPKNIIHISCSSELLKFNLSNWSIRRILNRFFSFERRDLLICIIGSAREYGLNFNSATHF